MATKISTNNDTGDITSNGGSIDLPATLPASGATLITNSSLQYVGQTASPFMRNRIINGAQMINQRYVDAPIAPGNSTYVNDRWVCFNTLASGSFLAARCQGWSNYFNGSTDYLSVNRILDTAGDVTVEAWIYMTATPPVNGGYVAAQYVAAGADRTIFTITSTRLIAMQFGASGVNGTTALALNTWHHVAWVRSGAATNNFKMYANGVLEGQITYTGSFQNTPTTIGASPNLASTFFPGYISNVRIVKGTALYTANFTPPTLPLVRVANTALLTCASETFQDKSANNFTISTVGTPTVSSLSPFTNAAPAGFTSGLMWSVLTPASAGAAERATIVQRIEGTSVADLAWGTASAKTVTVSFWVRSPVTGTYCLSAANNGGIVSYVAEYAINAANTWEQKTISIPGPTSGTFATDTSNCFSIRFDLGSGSNFTTTPGSWQSGDFLRTTNQTNFVGTALASGAQSNNFIITGVQLELGSVATPFEFRPMQAEVALCQRYFARLNTLTGTAVTFGNGVAGTTTVAYVFIKYPVTMRANLTNITQSNTALYDTAFRPVTSVTGLYRGLNSAGMVLTASGGGMTINRAVIWCGNANSAAYVDLDAEL